RLSGFIIDPFRSYRLEKRIRFHDLPKGEMRIARQFTAGMGTRVREFRRNG
ncbi:MAG: hypothetical protein ACI9VS_003436, partial [Candidatus Binatia bacterium]